VESPQRRARTCNGKPGPQGHAQKINLINSDEAINFIAILFDSIFYADKNSIGLYFETRKKLIIKLPP